MRRIWIAVATLVLIVGLACAGATPVFFHAAPQVTDVTNPADNNPTEQALVGSVCGDGVCAQAVNFFIDADTSECWSCPLDCAVNKAPALGWDPKIPGCAPLVCGDGVCTGDECDHNSLHFCAADCHAGDWTFNVSTHFCQYKTACGDGWCHSDECYHDPNHNPPPGDGIHACAVDCPRLQDGLNMYRARWQGPNNGPFYCDVVVN